MEDLTEEARKVLAALKPHEQAFVLEFSRTGKAGPAYRNARQPGTISEYAANTQGWKLLREEHIGHAVRVVRRGAAYDLGISKNDVLKAWVKLAFADPQELMQPRHLCCRYCHGKEHAYHWRDEREYAAAVDEALANAERLQAPAVIPSCEGGYGFRKNREPHADCPQCDGEGYLDVFIADGNRLSESGRALFAGIKRTKDGVEVKTRDQDAALANLARYLGMLSSDVKIRGSLGVVNAGDVELTDEQRAALRAAVLGLVE